MKLHVFSLSLALVTFVTCCRAVIIPDSAAHYADNFRTAIEAANKAYPYDRDFGRFVGISPWQGDKVLYNNIMLHLRYRPPHGYARVADEGEYWLHAMDWKTDHPERQSDPNDRLFLFAMHQRQPIFVPLGFVRYDYNGIPHAREAFWEHSKIRRYRYLDHKTMKMMGGFPPQMKEPRRTWKK